MNKKTHPLNAKSWGLTLAILLYKLRCHMSFTDIVDLLPLSHNWAELALVCTWHWCRGLTPSWHIQHWKSCPYTGPSWWPPATHPLCSHWTLGWMAPPCWDTKHTHNSITSFPPDEWLVYMFFWLVLQPIICPFNLNFHYCNKSGRQHTSAAS